MKFFEPKFRSLKKDSDRYFDALVALSDAGTIQTSEVIHLSGEGSLWISYQYIEKGFFDLVETNLKATVTSRDFFGPLFRNTRLILDRLLSVSEHDRVMGIYRDAIAHRLKTIMAKVALSGKRLKDQIRSADVEWARHHMPR